MTSEWRVFFQKLLTLLTGQSAGAQVFSLDANIYKLLLAKMYGMTMGAILHSQHFMLMHVIMSDLL